MSSSDAAVLDSVFFDLFDFELQLEVRHSADASASNFRDMLVAQPVWQRAYEGATEVAIEIPGHHWGKWARLHYSISDPVIVTRGHHLGFDLGMETSSLTEKRDWSRFPNRLDELNSSTSRGRRSSGPGSGRSLPGSETGCKALVTDCALNSRLAVTTYVCSIAKLIM